MTEVKQVSGVSFNYVNFLWENIAEIRRQQRDGNVVYALRLLTSLITYLPKDIQKKFQQKANRIDEELFKLVKGVDGSTLLTRHLSQNRAAKLFAAKMFKEFMGEVSSMLDSRGYMERVRDVPTGYSHTYLEGMRRQGQK